MTKRRVSAGGLWIGLVDDDGEALEQWRYVHNVVVPPAAMSVAEARERLARGYRLENAYDGDVLVGCATVRPVVGGVGTVIARVLPEFRRRGFGTALYEHVLAYVRGQGAEVVETCVLGVNEDGLRFAARYGFAEVERYVLDGKSDEWVDLRLVL
ncbi:GNAT family N-acetyltransferase [Streptomyces sp. Ag109_O5-10]|uniref:GNAT family N-acetyltransferase n=1 Tax=Streptomyces sp. Ag109_O5-10 TaxID=1855349 RepID=UPI00089C793E|nr:GNAT family N-acetyltransferase [Streptomyces sp. Ag109_O5-10]SEE97075.1 Acetyltransferase (GNAT) family protein [Streptomyces sp. Ag109_O5-10]